MQLRSIAANPGHRRISGDLAKWSTVDYIDTVGGVVFHVEAPPEVSGRYVASLLGSAI